MQVREGEEVSTSDLKPSVIPHDKKTKFLEGDSFFIIGNEIRFYVIPKSAFGDRAEEVAGQFVIRNA